MGFFLDITQLRAVRGASEERNEPYKRYGEASTTARQQGVPTKMIFRGVKRSNAPIAISADSCAVRQEGGVYV